MVVKRKRFESFTEEEIKQKRRNTIPNSIIKINIKWEKVFREYLTEKRCRSTEYCYYPDDELDSLLCHFWFEVRTQKSELTVEEKNEAKSNNRDLYPERYTIASLCNLQNGLTRCLQDHSRNINLTNDPKYKNSQNAFKDACKDLKNLGKGQVKSYPETDHAGD